MTTPTTKPIPASVLRAIVEHGASVEVSMDSQPPRVMKVAALTEPPTYFDPRDLAAYAIALQEAAQNLIKYLDDEGVWYDESKSAPLRALLPPEPVS